MANSNLVRVVDSSSCLSVAGRPYTFPQNVDKNEKRSCRELRSFSQPETNFNYTNENRILSASLQPVAQRNEFSTEEPSKRSNDKIKISAITFLEHIDEPDDQRTDLKLQLITLRRCNSFEKAQQYFAESGILGPTNQSQSRQLIKKTSRIHLDPSVKSQIRKTSLGLRSRNFGQQSPSSISPQTCTPLESSKDLIIKKIQKETYALRGIIETGETKIIMLRAEVNKIKRVLQEMMYANSITETNLSTLENLCVFCQGGPGLFD